MLCLLPNPREITYQPGVCARTGVNARIDLSTARSQGYRLTISTEGISIIGHDADGLRHGTQTLFQIRAQCPGPLPCLTIADWPDFPVRGVMLDISRDKVPTMETLFALVDRVINARFREGFGFKEAPIRCQG